MSMGLLRAATVAAVASGAVALVAPPAPAAGLHGSRPVGQPRQLRLPGVRTLLSDGRRFVLLKTYRNDGARVLDTRTGGSVAVQQPCAAVPAGATQGTFAVRCDDNPFATKLSLVDARSGRVIPVAEPNPCDLFNGGFGRQWLAGSTCHPGPDPSGGGTTYGWVYYNWHTGERREYPQTTGSGPPVLNLATPELRPGPTPRPVSAIRVSSRRLKHNLDRGDTWQVTAAHKRRHASWRITNILPVDDIFFYGVGASDEVLTAATDYMVFTGVLDEVVTYPSPSGDVHPNLLALYRFYGARFSRRSEPPWTELSAEVRANHRRPRPG